MRVPFLCITLQTVAYSFVHTSFNEKTAIHLVNNARMKPAHEHIHFLKCTQNVTI